MFRPVLPPCYARTPSRIHTFSDGIFAARREGPQWPKRLRVVYARIILLRAEARKPVGPRADAISENVEGRWCAGSDPA